MVEHTEEGAFGVVLNRPAETTVGEAVPDLAELTGAEEPVRIGGPVSTDSVVMLGEFEDPDASPKQIVGSLGLVDPGERRTCARPGSMPATPAGARASSSQSSSAMPGWSRTRSRATRSVTRTSGSSRCSGGAANTRCWPRCPTTPR